MKHLFKPPIDYKNAFEITYYSKNGFNCSAVMDRATQKELKIIGKLKIPYGDDKRLVRVYIDSEGNLWYCNDCLWGWQDTESKVFWQVKGWCKIKGVKELVEQEYSALEIKSALAMYILDKEKCLSSKYEDILLGVVQAYISWKNAS